MTQPSSAPVLYRLSPHTVLRLSGPDRLRFLNGQVTQDVHLATRSTAVPACVLNAKGQLEAVCHIREEEESYLIDAPIELRDSLFARLDRYLIADDVELTDESEDWHVAHLSPEAVDVLAGQANIEWIVPVSLGDSHRGFRVVGTTVDYFERYQYGRSQSLQFSAGRAFAAAEDIVLGSEVARQLRYRIGNPIVLSHGVADESFHQHDQQPFAVSGILAPTGTPIDNALFASLQAIDAIHDDGAREPGQDEEGHHDAEAHDHGHNDAPEGDHTAEEHGHDAKVHTDEQQHHTEEHDDAAANENGAEEDHPADDHHAHDEPDANHQEVKEGSHHAAHRAQPDGHDHDDDHPHTGVSRPVTALLVGVNSPFASLRVQRWIPIRPLHSGQSEK